MVAIGRCSAFSLAYWTGFIQRHFGQTSVILAFVAVRVIIGCSEDPLLAFFIPLGPGVPGHLLAPASFADNGDAHPASVRRKVHSLASVVKR